MVTDNKLKRNRNDIEIDVTIENDTNNELENDNEKNTESKNTNDNNETLEKDNKKSRVPAKVYPFKLDKFQQDAVDYIEKNESVLVAAHTSAGKTATAEYAVAKCFRDKQKVIYTSPIKALSNQKFRDMQEEFGEANVGLMTGDMTLCPNATCLIMTTEILLSMLYRGSEILREVAWVIFDEVHYMRDKERGVVWEESIILLPHKVRFLFLSATIPNAQEFVDWVAKIHRQPCHIVYTDYRPVPLQHFLFPAGASGLYLVVDDKSNFRQDNFEKAMGVLTKDTDVYGYQTQQDNNSGNKKGRRKSTSRTIGADLYKIVELVMEKQLDPCIVFSFSKKDCETYAMKMAKLDFNNNDEKQLVETVYNSALESLGEEDRNLPQIEALLPLLQRGIGIHHGGLLPILKEVIEILFQEGLIKCLFATETFAIGINMPARTVIFTQTRKFDGEDFRWISSGEYIQMSGRAGRRGKDDKGLVIQMIDEQMEPDVAKDMLYGKPDALISSYHVTYNMVINMLRVEDANPENLLKYSFYQYQQEKDAPVLENQANEYETEARKIEIPNDDIVTEYMDNLQLLEKQQNIVNAKIQEPEICVPFLQQGRMIKTDAHWGVVTKISKEHIKSTGRQSRVMELLLVKNEDASDKVLADCTVTYELSRLRELSAVRLNLPSNLTKFAQKKGVYKAMKEVLRRFNDEPPLLDPVEDMGIDDAAFAAELKQISTTKETLASSSFHNDKNKSECMEAYKRRLELLDKCKSCRTQARAHQAVTMRGELTKMKNVLRLLDYISIDEVLTIKGKFSCHLNSGDELLVTEMIFDGAFNNETPEMAVAIVSCFVFQEKVKLDAPPLQKKFQPGFRILQASARKIAKSKIESDLVCDEEEYVNSWNPGMMEISHEWAAGCSFTQICALSDNYEGNIIRNFRRLDELLRQLAGAAAAIGNIELKDKFETGADKIRRGVVFAASLYF